MYSVTTVSLNGTIAYAPASKTGTRTAAFLPDPEPRRTNFTIISDPLESTIGVDHVIVRQAVCGIIQRS